MTTDSYGPKEQTKGGSPARVPVPAPAPAPAAAPAPVAVKADASQEAPAEEVAIAEAPSKRGGGPTRLSLGAFGSSPRNVRGLGFLVAFAVGAIGVLALFMIVAMSFAGSYTNRVLPGVKAGDVDLSGSTRDEAVQKLQAGFASMGTGQITITTPAGTATIGYGDAGRAPDVEVMADAAFAVGHSGGGIGDAFAALHSALFGESVPVVVHVDPSVLAQRLHDLVGKNDVEAKDAQAVSKDGNFSFTPASGGRTFDEGLMGAALIDSLTQVDPPAQIETGGTFTDLKPTVSDADAQVAITQAEKIVVDVKLTWSTAPAAAPATWAPKSWTITAATIRSWVVFGTRPDGKYGPTIDLIKAQAYLSGLSAKANVQPKEPSVNWDPTGTKPLSLKEGQDGTGIDFVATSTLLATYLDTLATGGTPAPSLEIATMPIRPKMTDVSSISGMVIIGKWTTTFYPDVSNGNGKNIRQPAANLNGVVIGPGQQFSFLGAVGPIDPAHGFAMGGVILNGQSNHTGAMGGGICSASTTVFNAAGWAGLQIDERHQHAYSINRYPVGKDATVYSNGTTTYDLKWTNDTPNPIVIRSWATYGSSSSITVQLWSLPTNRTVTWPAGVKGNVAAATDGKQYVGSLKPGQTLRAEYVTDGYDTTVNRVVKDQSGAVLHNDTWKSHYTKVNGVLQIGGTPPPSGSTSPSPGAPSPTPGAPASAAPTAPPATPAPTPVPATPAPTPVPVSPAPVTSAPAAPPSAAPPGRRRRPKSV